MAINEPRYHHAPVSIDYLDIWGQKPTRIPNGLDDSIVDQHSTAVDSEPR